MYGDLILLCLTEVDTTFSSKRPFLVKVNVAFSEKYPLNKHSSVLLFYKHVSNYRQNTKIYNCLTYDGQSFLFFLQR